MGWNDIHVALAPTGSEIVGWTDPLTTTPQGDPIRIISVQRATGPFAKLVRQDDIQSWLLGVGFKLSRSNAPHFTYAFDDITLTVTCEAEAVVQVSARFDVAINARVRLPAWRKFVDELCANFELKLVDTERGLTESGDFVRLVEE